MRKINCIGILTSGGDAPGMNAAIRAVTRSAIANGFRVKAIYRGYEGLINGEIREFCTEDVSNIIQRGGTILKTARSRDFETTEGRQRAYENMCANEIDALIVIGGNGSLTGARIFAEEFDVPCIGLPGTIDNDLNGTDSTIGYDTTLNTIMECVDKIRDTATSHERIFFVEVMGRDAGFLAQNSAIAAGAEAAIIPEDSTGANQLVGKGDMLFLSGNDPVRVQCAFVDTPEVENIVSYIACQQSYNHPFPLPEVAMEGEGGGESPDVDMNHLDPMLPEVARMVVTEQSGSTSMIQRKFSIGYNRAGRLMDQLEKVGIVGPAKGSKPREVLCATETELQNKLNNI